MLGLGGPVVIWSKGGTEEDWVLEAVVEVDGEVVLRGGGVGELGFVQVVGDEVAAGNVLVEGLQPEMMAGMRPGEICFTG